MQANEVPQMAHTHYRRFALLLACMTLAMATTVLVFFPGLPPGRWIIVWTLWAVATTVACGVSLGGSLLREMLPCLLPVVLTALVFTGSVLIFGGTPLYLTFMWGIFFGLALLACRNGLPPRAALHGWATLIASLLVSMGSFFVTIDPTLLAAFLFAAIPLATASRR